MVVGFAERRVVAVVLLGGPQDAALDDAQDDGVELVVALLGEAVLELGDVADDSRVPKDKIFFAPLKGRRYTFLDNCCPL